MDTFLLDPLLRNFLAEDLEHGDITTEAIFAPEDQAEACFIARHPMTVVGMATVAAAWGYLGRDAVVEQWGADYVATTPIELLNWLELP